MKKLKLNYQKKKILIFKIFIHKTIKIKKKDVSFSVFVWSDVHYDKKNVLITLVTF